VENGDFVYANRRISEISGYSTEDLIRMGSTDLVSPEDKMKMEEIIQNTHPDSRGQNEITFWINRKDGTRRCILGRVTAAAQGKTISTYVTMTDVTESAERERALRDRISSLQQLIS